MTQEKVQILLALLEFPLEELVQLLDLRLGRRISHLLSEHRKVPLSMRQVCLSVELPAGLHVAGDEFCYFESCDGI